MKQIKYLARNISLALFSLLFLGTLSFGQVALARDGSSGDGTKIEPSDSVVADNTSETKNHSSVLSEQFKEQAQERLKEARQNIKEQTQEHRQKSCEARKTALTKRMNRSVTQAQKHKEVFDKIYTRVKAFYTDKQLNVADYSSLTAKVDTAQANAADSIAALKSLDVSVDCTSQTVADSVSTFQQALKSTRDSLKTYRAALKDLIKAVKGASTGAENTNNNSANQ